jgi:kynureninase
LEFSKTYAYHADQSDPLASFRDRFVFPQHNGEPVLYFLGNSLGLLPKTAAAAIQLELDAWGKLGVDGHFEGMNPWYKYHERMTSGLASLAGSQLHEVVAMNGLTTNLHLLFASFYRPSAKKYKILTEDAAFPSDQYVVESQLKFHGFNPKTGLIALKPQVEKHTLTTEEIVDSIEKHADELALVFMGGVNYYTGQVLDMKTITTAAHRHGIIIGFDLAHAFGNIPLHLHDWNVDFAAWCSYKYLNSGPGSIAGVFIHEKHGLNPDTPRLAGWWGYHKQKRFLMEPGFLPIPGAEGWQLSNAPILAMAPHKEALDIHFEVGMESLRAKSVKLTQYLAFILQEVAKNSTFKFEVITPLEVHKRGAQLSILIESQGKSLFQYLQENGVRVDWREPGVIRIAPVPLYNSYMDIYQFGRILESYY